MPIPAFRLHEAVLQFLSAVPVEAQDAALLTLHELEERVARDAKLRGRLADETHPIAERLDVLKGAGFRLEAESTALLEGLFLRHAFNKLGAFVREAKRLREGSRSAREATIVSAIALGRPDVVRIQEVLERKWGIHVLLHERIDPSLIGGFKVLADGWFFDATIQGRAERVARSLETEAPSYAHAETAR